MSVRCLENILILLNSEEVQGMYIYCMPLCQTIPPQYQ